MTASVEAARQEISGLVADPPPGALLADAAVRALGRVIGHDGYCLFGVDPATGLRSVMFSRHGLTAPTEELLHNETVERDANRYVDLVAAPVPVGALTPRCAPHSRRLHELLRQDGYRSELRIALTTAGRYWGALSLFRDDPHRHFSDQDVSDARALVPAMSEVLRRYQVGRPPRDVVGDGTPVSGAVWLDGKDAVVGMDEEARAWLGSMSHHWRAGVVPEDMLRCVHEVAGAARRTGTLGESQPTLARTRVAGGGWLVASGTFVGGSEVDVVVHLRSGDVATVLPAFAAWCGLSARESDVLRLLVQGLAAKQVARRLGISVLTVGDHQRSLYRKAGVRGRDELVSLLV
jgi:DNA-binding CsgD family transcriptional regulator